MNGSQDMHTTNTYHVPYTPPLSIIVWHQMWSALPPPPFELANVGHPRLAVLHKLAEQEGEARQRHLQPVALRYFLAAAIEGLG